MKINKFFSDILNLSYILEDEGINFYINGIYYVDKYPKGKYLYKSPNMPNNYLALQLGGLWHGDDIINPDLELDYDHITINVSKFIKRSDPENEIVHEFFDRVSEILKEYGLEVKTTLATNYYCGIIKPIGKFVGSPENNYSWYRSFWGNDSVKESNIWGKKSTIEPELGMMQFLEDLFEFNYILSDEGIRFAINVVGYPEKYNNVVGNIYPVFGNGVYETHQYKSILDRCKITVSNPSFVLKSIKIIIDEETEKNKEFIGEYLDRIDEVLNRYNFEITSSELIFNNDRHYKEYKIVKKEAVKESMNCGTVDIKEFFNEILELNYILEDEGVQFVMGFIGHDCQPQEAYISHGSGDEFGVKWQNVPNDAAGVDRLAIYFYYGYEKSTNEINEYFDRIKEISEKYNFKIFKIKVSKDISFQIVIDQTEGLMRMMDKYSVKENMIYASGHSKSLIEEILELNYILEDEDIDFVIFNGHEEDRYGGHRDNYIYQSDKRKREVGSIETDYNLIRIVLKKGLSETTREYYDRVQDICKRHKYNCHKNRYHDTIYKHQNEYGKVEKRFGRFLDENTLNIIITKKPDYKKLKKQSLIKESFNSKSFLEEILNLNHILQDENIGFAIVLNGGPTGNLINSLQHLPLERVAPKTLFMHTNGNAQIQKDVLNEDVFKIDVKFLYSRKFNDVIKKEQEFIEEYFDRIKDVCEENGFSAELKKLSMGNSAKGIVIEKIKLNESMKPGTEALLLILNRCNTIEEYKEYLDKSINFIKDILELNYILKDENLEYRFMGMKLEEGQWFLIEDSRYNDINEYDYIFSEVMLLFRLGNKVSENEHYQEYKDRVSEIAEKYDFRPDNDSSGNLVFKNNKKESSFLGRTLENSSNVDKFISEIRELSYIVEDEGFTLDVLGPDEREIESGLNKRTIGSKFPRLSVRGVNLDWTDFIHTDWYQEFVDRVTEIAISHGYKTQPMKLIPSVIYFVPEKLNESVKNPPTIKEIVGEIIDLSYILKDVNTDMYLYGVLNNNGAQHLIYNSHNRYISKHYDGMHYKFPFKSIELYIGNLALPENSEECGEFADRLLEFCEGFGLKVSTNKGRDIKNFQGGIISIELPKPHRLQHLQSLKEAKSYKSDIEKMFDEISAITYILKDRGDFEDWKIELKELATPTEMYSKKGSRTYKIVGEIANIFIRSNAILLANEETSKNLPELADVYEDYSEFFDRCKEIVNGFGYELEKSNSASCIRIIDTQEKVRFSKHTSKFTRRIRESVSNIDSLISEISDLSYIMEDEGFQVSVKENRKKLPFNSVFQIELSHNKKFTTLLTQTNYYKEYIDRIREICLSFGYGIHIIKSGMIILAQKITKPRRIMESKKEDLKSEIENLFFLMQDEGYKCFNITMDISKEICPGYEFSVCFSGGNEKIPSWYVWSKHLFNSDCYIEFIDRLEEICHEHNREAMIMGIDTGFFYADTIRIVNKDEYEDLGWRKEKMGKCSSKEFTIKEFKKTYLRLDESYRSEQLNKEKGEPTYLSKEIAEKVMDEIKELTYILEDEGVDVSVNLSPISQATGKPKTISVQLIPKDIKKYIEKANIVNNKNLNRWKKSDKYKNYRKIFNQNGSVSPIQSDLLPPRDFSFIDIFIKEFARTNAYKEFRDRIYEIARGYGFTCSRYEEMIIINNPPRYPEKITESIKVESYNQKALDVINEYIYIFKDCGIHPEINELISGMSFKYIGILVSKNSVETITQSDEYEEFMDRVKEELSDKYYIKSMNGNYAWILIEKKMNIDGSPKLNEKFSNVTIDSPDISGNTKPKNIELTDEEIRDVLVDLTDNNCEISIVKSNQFKIIDHIGKLKFEMFPKIEVLISIPNKEFMETDTYEDAIGGFEDYLDIRDLSIRTIAKLRKPGPMNIIIEIFKKEDFPTDHGTNS